MEFEDSFTARMISEMRGEAGPDAYAVVLGRVRDRLSREFAADQLTNAGPKVTAQATRVTREALQQYNHEMLNQSMPRIMIPEEQFVQMVLADLLGMGPIDTLLKDETIEDIAINGPNEVMVYRDGGWEEVDIQFESPTRLLEILNRGIAFSNRKANMVTPIADAVLPGKERISVVTYPIANPHPTAVIRIPRAKNINLEDMIRPDEHASEKQVETTVTDYESLLEGEMEGMLSPKAAKYLHAAVVAGLNIVAVGPTGSGKTTLLMALGRKIPKGQRILIIEETPEIELYPDTAKPNNVLYLRTRPASTEGLEAVEQEELVKLALRQRPDALTLGEARGAEVFDLLNALITGHKNGLTSLHAYGVEELFRRVYLMLAQSERGRFLDPFRAANLVASTLHIAISLELVGRTRQVRTIGELTGKVGQRGTSYEPEMKAIFQRTGTRGKLEGPLEDSAHAAMFKQAGIREGVFTVRP